MKNFLKILALVLGVLFLVATIVMGCIYRDEVIDAVEGIRSKASRWFGKKNRWAE